MNLSNYLHLVFQKAIYDAYPDVRIENYSLRFFLSQNQGYDLFTPVARQLTSLLNIKIADLTAHRIIANIKWDDNFISSISTETLINSGFITFTISHKYLERILSQDFSKIKKSHPSALHTISFSTLYTKLKRLIHYADTAGFFSESAEQSDYRLLTIREERDMLVVLAALELPELNSGKSFLLRKLITLAENYYSKTQLLSKNKVLSTTRLQLIRRVVEKIEMHLYLF